MSKTIRELVSLVFDTNFLINYNSKVLETQENAKKCFDYYSRRYQCSSFCSEIVIAEFDVYNDFSLFQENLNFKRLPFGSLESKLCAQLSRQILDKKLTYKNAVFDSLMKGLDTDNSNKEKRKILDYIKDTIKDDLKILSTYITHNGRVKKIFLTSDQELIAMAKDLDIEKEYNVKLVNYLSQTPEYEFLDLPLFGTNNDLDTSES